MDGVAKMLQFGTPQQVDELLQEVAKQRERVRADTRRVWTAMMLARDLDTCGALLRGDYVPRHRLDPQWLHLLERWPQEAA